MTLKEFLEQNKDRDLSFPNHMIQAQDEKGNVHNVCLIDLGGDGVEYMTEKFPDFLGWEVTKDRFTWEEFHALRTST